MKYRTISERLSGNTFYVFFKILVLNNSVAGNYKSSYRLFLDELIRGTYH